jgi:hypothetical protein
MEQLQYTLTRKKQRPPEQPADSQADPEEALYGSPAHIQLPHTIAVHIHCVSGVVCGMLSGIYPALHPAYDLLYQLLQSKEAILSSLTT